MLSLTSVTEVRDDIQRRVPFLILLMTKHGGRVNDSILITANFDFIVPTTIRT